MESMNKKICYLKAHNLLTFFILFNTSPLPIFALLCNIYCNASLILLTGLFLRTINASEQKLRRAFFPLVSKRTELQYCIKRDLHAFKRCYSKYGSYFSFEFPTKALQYASYVDASLQLQFQV